MYAIRRSVHFETRRLSAHCLPTEPTYVLGFGQRDRQQRPDIPYARAHNRIPTGFATTMENERNITVTADDLDLVQNPIPASMAAHRRWEYPGAIVELPGQRQAARHESIPKHQVQDTCQLPSTHGLPPSSLACLLLR